VQKKLVSITRYEKPYQSVKKAVTDCRGLDHLPSGARVFIKPNIVFWSKSCVFPKWGVITTSRVIEDIVVLLKEYGIEDITIGEGTVAGQRDRETQVDAFKRLGYETLGQRYGVKYINVMERTFEKVDLGDGVSLKFNQDILESDFVINIPAMKSHNQTVVSLGIKNLKGTIDVQSRKNCHSSTPEKNLDFYVSKLADKMPPMLTLIDGIYTLARGPAFDGRMKRSNVLVASADILSADMVGAMVLGHSPANVPHLVMAAKKRMRPLDLSDIVVVGETIEDVESFHECDFEYSSTENGEMPVPLAKQGISGLFYRKFDSSMCTYCSALNGVILASIRSAWKGEPWNNVEVLTGKIMEPAPGMSATILVGKCMYKANKNHPNIQKMLAVKGCPPKPMDIVNALTEAGIKVDGSIFAQIDILPGFFMGRYKGQPEFDESFYTVV
jgi:uncharacterized protein (DUF362 family)